MEINSEENVKSEPQENEEQEFVQGNEKGFLCEKFQIDVENGMNKYFCEQDVEEK